ncbi:hypothetical protein LTR08_001099 [Meristemomyces frigidus]|nr:hypothetical protein LTR08_001099 [Meristemomyces frigidus]
MASKRLIKELDQYSKEPSPAVTRLELINDDDLTRLTASLRGPDGTAYEGGLWTLSISIPYSYPNTPPDVRFLTPICHANISFTTGEICLDLLKASWTPAYTVVSTLEAVHQLLNAGGEPDSPLNMDIAKLLRDGDLVGAESLVRFYTRKHAMG